MKGSNAMSDPAARRFARGVVAAVVATASVGFAAAWSAPARSKSEEAAERGETLAKQSCGSCHGIGLTGESNWAGAPAFRDMRVDYNAISYERRMAQLHQGHVRMPPAEISLDDVLDIRAYVRSLRRASKR